MKAILLHVYDDEAFEGRLTAALDLARSADAHLTCLHATPFEDYLRTDPWVAARLPEEFSTKMRTLRHELQERVEARLRREGVQWDWVHCNETMAGALVRWSILADVAVVSQAQGAFERDDPRPLAAAVATAARAPVLVVPETFEALRTDRPVLIAWNGSAEAAAAAHAAVPLLRMAPSVTLLEVEERPRAYPRDLMARYLSRHGVHAEIVQRPPAHGDVGATIADTAREIGAGLIVMGAYGHSRLREFLLGGVTRSLIGGCEIPLLMAH